MVAFKIFSILAVAASVLGLPTGSSSGIQLATRQSVLNEVFTGDGISIFYCYYLWLRLLIVFCGLILIAATFFEPGLGACGQTDGPNDLIAAASHALFDSFPSVPSPCFEERCLLFLTKHRN